MIYFEVAQEAAELAEMSFDGISHLISLNSYHSDPKREDRLYINT